MDINALRIAALEYHIGLLEVAASSCETVPRKQFSGTSTQAGDICRLETRVDYLQAVIACEQLSTNLEQCCKDAAQDYCDAWDACPA